MLLNSRHRYIGESSAAVKPAGGLPCCPWDGGISHHPHCQRRTGWFARLAVTVYNHVPREPAKLTVLRASIHALLINIENNAINSSGSFVLMTPDVGLIKF